MAKVSEAMLSQSKDSEVANAIGQAAWQLEDAIAEKVCKKYPKEYEARELFFSVINAKKMYNRALLMMILLTIFETPTWCDTSHTWRFDDPQQSCILYGEPTKVFPRGKPIEVMLSGITYLPPGYALILEVCILATLAYSLYKQHELQVKYFKPLQQEQEEEDEEEDNEKEEDEEDEGPQDYVSMKLMRFLMLMITIALVDCAVFFIVRPKLRVAFLARTAIFCMLPSVINLYRCISKILVEVATVAVFFVGFLFFFAWVSVMIFNGDPDPPEHFETFGNAFYGLFIAGICDEFTDILIVSYTRIRLMGVLWFVFLLVVHLLFLSLVLDTLCAGYMKSEEEDKEKIQKQKAQGLIRAFNILNQACHLEPHRISLETFMAFVKEYSRSPGVHALDWDYARIAFEDVDADGDGKIDEEEFARLCVLAQYQMWVTRRDSMIKESFPGFWDSDRRMFGCFPSVREVRQSVSDPNGAFESIMTSVLTVNFMLVIIETTYDLSDSEEPFWTAWLEFVFSFVYLGECMFKIGVSGWDFYSSSTSNIFDFGTTMLLLSTSIFESMLGALSTYANILRLFRLLRVVKQLKGLDSVQFMVSTVIKMVQKAKDMLVLLLVVMFGFTVVGVQLFGGLLYEENPLLEGTDYHEAKEYVLNFNDFLMAFGLWFVNLLCEYKPSFAGAIHKVSWSGAWLICALFWGIAVCITFELVKAFTIEVYIDLRKKWKTQTKDAEIQHPYPIFKAIYGSYDSDNKQFWYQCLSVDEDEFEGVIDEVAEQVEDAEKEEQKREKKKEEREARSS
jgi:hypothetical protein